MAPKAKSSTENMKQKSLMGWFGKTPTQDEKKPKKPVGSASKSVNPITPKSKKVDTSVLLSSAAASTTSSAGGSSGRDTPPTSDAIDVDMDEDEDDAPRGRTKSSKRKILEDSDEDTPASSVRMDSSPLGAKSRAKKKQRISVPPSDEEEDEEDAESAAKLSSRLSRFKRPVTKSRSRSASSSADDDDFIVPDDEDEEDDRQSIKSRSSRSSASSELEEDEDEEDDAPKGKKRAPAKKKGASVTAPTTPSDGGSSFLTAAERREQQKKTDKKAGDDPYSFLQVVKDKDGRRPGDPMYDPRTLYVPKSAWSEFTPFEKQFWEIKQNHYDTILFFQKGKFYELYEDDARIGHQEFDLKLTQRVKMSMVGVPEMSFDFWAAKFLGKGYKVGKVEQAETALGAEMRAKAGKGGGKPAEKEKIVRRELHKVFTNGTLVDPQMLTDDHAGHIISLRESEAADGKMTFGVCVLDCSTSQFELSVFEDDICRTKLETLMRQARPKELLFTKGQLSVSTTRLLKTFLPAECLWTGLRDVEGFTYDETIAELKTLYPAEEEDAEDESALSSSVPESIRGMSDSDPAMRALGAMIWYLRQLNIDKDILSMKNFNVYDPMKKGLGLVLDGQTLAHIEVLQNNEGTLDGTLLQLLSRCVTPFGKRLFRIWLCMPLSDVKQINDRLDAVQDLMNHPTFEADFAELAKGLPDLERVVSRIHAKNCKVKDFVKVLASFKKLSRGMSALADTSDNFDSKSVLGLLRGAPDLLPNIKNVESMYVKPEKDANELHPEKGKDAEYDAISKEIRKLEKSLDAELEELQDTLNMTLGWWHSAVGNKDIYLVETSANQKKIPMEWKKEGGTKAKTRYSIPGIQKTVRALKEARETRTAIMKAFKNRVFEEFDSDRDLWLRAIRVFAELDCLFSLAKSSVAMGEPQCRPEFVAGDSAFVEFEELRHPMIAMGTSKDFIPNNISLGKTKPRIALLTGPNMAGKSTVMRMTATGIIMAQLGMMVPASSARLSPVDSILTRMGAYDNMFSNASTFKVELDECCKILRDATPRSFVILDELGRGTSTFDGMAIAGAVLHELATHTLPLSFFATHYGTLTDDYDYHPNIRNMHMSSIVDEEKRDIVFLYKLVDGVATSSFGTHVANLAGVPFEVVERADTISKNFAEKFKARLEERQAKTKIAITAQADFAYLVGVATGKFKLPEDKAKAALVLKTLKRTVRKYLEAAPV
ncbi:DNA mismatch repair protein Msh6 [Cylindrobasidium torrendii FP15055 ss-10]|uniref:DNA mismatch repair protein n=1 Tax=Cylindrobasidium torrendii FP15055 ss-10 TaxID=1314674 RepID=A0A0D7BEK9_9AGAR|nr:DNA mismatch repair protein Msh6 [Cylindrobasidium torrendii FP15055 ss-10]